MACCIILVSVSEDKFCRFWLTEQSICRNTRSPWSSVCIQPVTRMWVNSAHLEDIAIYTVEEISFDRIFLRIAEAGRGGKIRYGFSTCWRGVDWKSRQASRSTVPAKKFSRPIDRVLFIIDYFSPRHRGYIVRQNLIIRSVKETYAVWYRYTLYCAVISLR